MIIRKITPEEVMEYRNISALAFEWSHDTEGKDPTEYIDETINNPTTKETVSWQRKYAAFNDKNEMMSIMHPYPFMAYYEGTPVKMDGISGVATYPHFRRNGAVRAIFEQYLQDAYDEGVVFSYLYAFSEAFYRKFGYERITQQHYIFEMNGLPSLPFKGAFELYRANASSNLDEYKNCYQRFAKQHNMMIERDEFDWEIYESAKPFTSQTFLYGYRRGDSIAGLVKFSKQTIDDKLCLSCDELIFDDTEAFFALINFLKTFQKDYPYLSFKTSCFYSFGHLCTDYADYDATSMLVSNGMNRVVNVEKALSLTHFRGNGHFVLEVYNDITLPINNGFYSIDYANGLVSSVKKTEQTTPHLRLSIQRLAQCLTGMHKAENLLYFSDVSINTSIENLKDFVYEKPYWQNNSY